MDNKSKVGSIAVLAVLLGLLGWYILNTNQKEQANVDTSDNTQDGEQAENDTPQGDLGGTIDPVDSDGKLPEQYRNKIAVVKTNLGSFTIEFFENDAPLAVENFIRLSLTGKYDGTPFHRIINNTIVQGGDYTRGDGTGGGSIWGKAFVDELNPEAESYMIGYDRGIIAMANAGPATNGSQFFINARNNKAVFPPNYTIFGRVVAGMDTIDKIASVETLENQYDEKSLPAERVGIEKITIEDKQ